VVRLSGVEDPILLVCERLEVFLIRMCHHADGHRFIHYLIEERAVLLLECCECVAVFKHHGIQRATDPRKTMSEVGDIEHQPFKLPGLECGVDGGSVV
jgi:hypothetical protein